MYRSYWSLSVPLTSENIGKESILRSAKQIKAELKKQLQAAMTGIQARVTELQTASGVKDKITEIWIEKLIS